MVKSGESLIRDDRDQSRFDQYLFKALFIFSVGAFLCFSVKGWNGSLSEMHGFRQTQTAITVRYMLRGGPWVAYETPVLGPPWAVPFEFPLYQWIVALVAQAGLFPLDQAGRFVSIMFFISTLYPIFKMLEAFKFSSNQQYIILTLYCLSPQYIYWSRAFMIESAALALSIHYLWFVKLNDDRQIDGKKRWLLLSGIGIFGSLAGMVKITTFFAFMVGALTVISVHFIQQATTEGIDRHKNAVITALLFAVLIPIAAVWAWTSYADSLKSLNPIANALTSSALRDWNFGTFSQKISRETWSVFYTRLIPDLMGNSVLLILYILIAVMCRPRYLILAGASLSLFLLPLLTFTNLHFRHNYYAYANGIFLIVAVGIVLADFYSSAHDFKRWVSYILFSLTVSYSVSHYLEIYWPVQGEGYNFSVAKKEFDRHIDENDVIVVFGGGWSSEMAYYLQRRAVMFPRWKMPDDLTGPYFRQVKKNLEGYKVGAVVFCHNYRFNDSFIGGVLSEFNFRDDPLRTAYPLLTAYFNTESVRATSRVIAEDIFPSCGGVKILHPSGGDHQ